MDRFSEFLEKAEKGSSLRSIPEEGSRRIDLLSNDYLGLGARSREFVDEFLKLYGDADFNSSASRLLSRKQKYHNRLEEKLEELYHKPALLFNTGYHANSGIISALGRPETTLFADELIHASARDGLMLAQVHRKSKVSFFRHNDVKHLAELIESDDAKEKIIVTEGIFSMDGDIGPLKELVELKHRHDDVLLYVDEAHSFGTRGELGLGIAEELGLIEEIDIIVGTFGKALASQGAFVVTRKNIRDYLINRARTFIFSTAIPPVNVAWTLFMLSKSLKMNEARRYLKELSEDFRKALESATGKPSKSSSHIIPHICTSAEETVECAEKLRKAGYDVLPIRHPSVPRGQERVRLSLNSELTLASLLPIADLLRSDKE